MLHPWVASQAWTPSDDSQEIDMEFKSNESSDDTGQPEIGLTLIWNNFSQEILEPASLTKSFFSIVTSTSITGSKDLNRKDSQ